MADCGGYLGVDCDEAFREEVAADVALVAAPVDRNAAEASLPDRIQLLLIQHVVGAESEDLPAG